MKATGCNQEDACDKFQPRIPGKCFRCGSTSHGQVRPKGCQGCTPDTSAQAASTTPRGKGKGSGKAPRE
eukprot:160703-Amphidinium_carterae.1